MKITILLKMPISTVKELTGCMNTLSVTSVAFISVKQDFFLIEICFFLFVVCVLPNHFTCFGFAC